MAAAVPAHVIAQVRMAQHLRPQRTVRGHFRPGHRLSKPLPRQQHPKAIEASFTTAIVARLHPMRLALKPLIDELPQLLGATRTDSLIRLDAGELQRVRQLLDRAKQALDGALDTRQLSILAQRQAQAVTSFQREQLAKQIRAALGVDLMTLDKSVPALVDSFVHQNVSLIKSLGTRGLDDVEKVVSRAFATGARAESIQGDIAERYDITDRHAALISRDQIGSLNGEVNAARQGELGIQSFQWQASEDERVRPEHQELNGKIFDYSDLPSEGLPGTPILCRCGAEPVFDSILAAAA